MTLVRQDALAAELGISKIPLREALTRLEEYGLLRSSMNRGYYVPALSAAEADEVFALRLKIEPEAAAQASLKADGDQVDAAKAALAALEAVSGVDHRQTVAFNRAFHLALIRPGNKQVTYLLVERLHVLAERYVHMHLEPAGRDARAHCEHRDLLEAWMTRDAESVAFQMSQHIVLTLRDLNEQLLGNETIIKSGVSQLTRR